MIFYSPVDGDVRQAPVRWRPRTAFLMQQIGGKVPTAVRAARRKIDSSLAKQGFKSLDASSLSTGKDYLSKIWELLLGCPLGIAIVHEAISPATLANIYFELGMLQAYGRETLVVRIGEPELPSDLVRTEWIPADAQLKTRIGKFLHGVLERADYFEQLASLVERDPLLAIDYLRRSAVLSNKPELRVKAEKLLAAAQPGDRAKASVEALMLRF